MYIHAIYIIYMNIYIYIYAFKLTKFSILFSPLVGEKAVVSGFLRFLDSFILGTIFLKFSPDGSSKYFYVIYPLY